MSDAAQRADARSRFIRLLGIAVIAAVIGSVIWALLSLGAYMLGQAEGIRCQKNLKSIIEAMTIYRSQHKGELPPYLTLLLPQLEGRAEALICPADPDAGRNGCRPAWLRRYDELVGDRAFAYVDLDGPGIDPERAADSVPCSYLYAANGYPCGLDEFRRTWRQWFAARVDKFGKDVPMVRCYYHLPERYATDWEGAADGPRPPDPDAYPTHNITADLEPRDYRLVWEFERRFSPQ